MILALTCLTGIAFATDDEQHAHKHHAAVFLGNTKNDKGQNAFTVGADYEYRFHKYWGAGALIDYAAPNLDAIILAGGVFLHPVGDLRLLAAPGIDHHHGHTEFAIRIGAMYDFHVGIWSISPTIHVDLLERKENLVYGIGFGRGF
jgi:hypothetical protein